MRPFLPSRRNEYPLVEPAATVNNQVMLLEHEFAGDFMSEIRKRAQGAVLKVKAVCGLCIITGNNISNYITNQPYKNQYVHPVEPRD